MAPTNKPPGQRQRRNAGQSEWQKLSDADARTDAPKWVGRKPPAAAQFYWDLIWASPMSAMYLDSDVPALMRICRLHAAATSGKASVSELGELRQLEVQFGLNPKARRSLQWEIERAAGPGQAHERQPVDDAQQRRAGRRDRLSLVG